MKRKTFWIRRWISILALIAMSIAIYKLFDSLTDIFGWLGRVIDVLTPFFIGLLFAFFLNRPVNFFKRLYEKCRWKFLSTHTTGISILTVYVIFFALLAVVLYAILPLLFHSVMEFMHQLPGYINAIPKLLEDFSESYPFLGELISAESIDLSSIMENVVKLTKLFDPENVSKYLRGVVSFSNALVDLVIGFIVSVYTLLEKQALKRVLGRVLRLFFKKEWINVIKKYTYSSCLIVFKYFVGQFCDAMIVAVLAAIVLSILRIPYGALLGVMVGLFNMIPYFGALIMGVAVCFLTLLSSGFFPALWTAIAIIVIQQVDSNIINPRILGNALKISPFWVLLAVTVGSGLFGFFGMLFSVPIFAVFRSFFMDWAQAKEQRRATAEMKQSEPSITQEGTEEPGAEKEKN